MSGGALHDLDEIRRRYSLVDMVGRAVKLRRAGRGFGGLCPFHQERTPSFTVNDEKGFYHCFGCGAHGDLFEWVVQTQGLTFRQAVEQLASGASIAPVREIEQRESRKEVRHDVVGSATMGRFIWSSAGPARGEIVETWLQSRGLDLDGVPGALDHLRFHRRCPVVPWRVHEDPEDAWLTAPAMVAPISDETGAVWGVHCTFLTPDGREKARLPRDGAGKERPTREIFGRMAGLAVWLTDCGSAEEAATGRPLVVGEGIETVWAWCQGQPGAYRAAAALSLRNLCGYEKRLKGGAVPLWRPQVDAERVLFTLPDQDEVILLVDADMKPLRDQKVQIERGAKPIVADIGPLERARLCAQLATQAWRGVGAKRVTAVRPHAGQDFNDALRSEAA